MRVCHVVYSYYPFDPRVRKETEALADAGYDVDVIAVRDEGELNVELVGPILVHRIPMSISRGGPVRYLFQYLLFFFLSSALLLRLYMKRRYRVIHVHSLPDFQVFCTLPERIFGAQVVLDLHEAFPEILAARLGRSMNDGLVLVAKGLEFFSCKYAVRVVVATQLRKKILARRGLPVFKSMVVMNSFDLPPAQLASDELRVRLGLEGRIVLVQAGGINPERDLGTLIDASARLAASRPLSLLLFGKGSEDYKNELRQIAVNTPELDFRIGEWMLPIAAFAHVALTDVGVVTYVRNPLTEIAAPHKVFDYVAAGKPLVLADLPGLREVWEGAALFYQPSDPEDLAQRVTQVLEMPELAQQLRSRASRILESCRWELSRAALVSMYQELLA